MTLPDIDTIDKYGGALVNDNPVEDPTTDRDAEAMNEALATTAGMTRTVARAWARVLLQGGGASLAAANGSDACWGNDVPPAPAAAGTGTYTVTWPATVEDDLGATHAVNLRWARVSVEGSTFILAQCEVTSANVVTVHTATLSGTPTSFSGTTVLVEAG